MVWTSDKSQAGLMKAKNCFTKILLNSCSIIDVHGYPERKKDNLPSGKKGPTTPKSSTESHEKKSKLFSYLFHIK